jgi:hypothetical protein
MDEMSKQDERRVLGALERAIGMTNDGTHPTEAIQKVAEDERFNPPMVQRMVEAYNVSKMLNHLGHVKGAARADTFPIASSETILQNMYPEQPQTTAAKEAAVFVPAEINRPETVNFNKVAAKFSDLLSASDFNKKAEVYGSDPELELKRTFAKRASLRKAEAEALSQVRRHYFEIIGLAKQAGSQFRFVAHRPFAEVEQDIVAAYGSMGKTAMDLIYGSTNLIEKRADINENHRAFFNQNDHPYRTVVAMIRESREFAKAAEVAAKASIAVKEYEQATGCRQPMTKASFRNELDSILGGDDSDDESFVKKSVEAMPAVPFVHQNVTDSMKNVANIGMSMAGVKPTPYEDVKEEVAREMADPVHETKLQGIRTQAILNDFISNDPVLSTYDPADLTRAYNQVAELSPSVSQQPAVLRGVLRRMMQQEGVIEPFEAQQLVGVDRHLRGMPGADSAAGQK